MGHGHGVGVALVEDPSEEAAELAARDVGEFDQAGCLSLQTVFAREPRIFAERLAGAMARYEERFPRGELELSAAGGIWNLRQEVRWAMAQECERWKMWEGEGWTVVFEEGMALRLSPGGRTVFVRPLEEGVEDMLRGVRFLSGIGLWPYEEREELPGPRIFRLGEAQRPRGLWAHDGVLALGALVRRQSFGLVE